MLKRSILEESAYTYDISYFFSHLEDGKVKVPEKMKKSCTGFSYVGPKLWNHLPAHIRKTTITGIFKNKMKDWIWECIPSV